MKDRPHSFHTALLPLLVTVGLVLLWVLLTALHAYSTALFPTPLQTWEAFLGEVRNGRLFADIIASLFRVFIGFGLAVIVGLPLGLWMGMRPGPRAALLPLVNFFRNLSPLAWIGFALIWFSVGTKAAVFLIFLSSVFPLALAGVAAVANVPNVYFRVARDYGYTGAQVFSEVTLPAAMPQIITALRVTAGLAWVVVVAAEMAGAQEGLGYAIQDARNGVRPDLLVVNMIVIGVLGMVIDRVLAQMTKIPAVRWGYER